MCSIVITGHGGFATGLEQAVTQIMGKPKKFFAVDFYEGMSTEVLEQQLRAVAAEATDDGILFITDILGGSPFQIAAKISQSLPGCEVLTGANLVLVLEVCTNRDTDSIEVLCEQAIKWGQSGVTSLYHQQQLHMGGEKCHVNGI